MSTNALFLAPSIAPTQDDLDDYRLNALRSSLRNEPRRKVEAAPAPKQVRALLARTGKFVASTPMLSAYIGSTIVREQNDHYIHEIVKWNLAMYDVSTMSGAPAPSGITTIGIDVAEAITRKVGDGNVNLKVAMAAVHSTLEKVYGKQMRVTGWLPGYRVAEGNTVLELSGNACPSCTVNPTGYKVGNKSNIARCLNSEDCGWTSA